MIKAITACLLWAQVTQVIKGFCSGIAFIKSFLQCCLANEKAQERQRLCTLHHCAHGIHHMGGSMQASNLELCYKAVACLHSVIPTRLYNCKVFACMFFCSDYCRSCWCCFRRTHTLFLACSSFSASLHATAVNKSSLMQVQLAKNSI